MYQIDCLAMIGYIRLFAIRQLPTGNQNEDLFIYTLSEEKKKTKAWRRKARHDLQL